MHNGLRLPFIPILICGVFMLLQSHSPVKWTLKNCWRNSGNLRNC